MHRLFKLNAIFFLFASIIAVMLCGCGSGGSSSVGFNENIPSVQEPPSSIFSSPTTSATGTKGFVYYKGSKNVAGNLIYSPEQLSSLQPATGAVVTIMSNPPMSTTTDSNGYFNFNISPELIQNSGLGMVIEFANSSAVYPVLPSRPVSEIHDFRIISSNSNQRDLNVVPAGSSTTLILTDVFGIAVQDPVTWKLSDPAMGSLNGSIFTAGNSNASGTITAIVNGREIKSQPVTITDQVDNFYGQVKDTNGNSTAGLLVSIVGFGVNYNNTTVTDINGNYSIPNAPKGYYYSLNIYNKAGEEISYTRENNNQNPPHNLIVSMNQSGIASSLTAKTVTDKLSYKPGETIQAALEITNLSTYKTTIANSKITYSLIEENMMTGTTTALNTAVGYAGELTIDPQKSVRVATPAALQIPSNCDGIMKYYTVTAQIENMNLPYIHSSSVVISSEVSGGGGTPTPPSPTDDASIIKSAKLYLIDCYWIVNDAVNEANSGESVSDKVNGSSTLVFKLNIIRNNVLANYSNIELKSHWRNQIDNIKSSLSRYVDSNDISYLKDARSGISELKRDLESR